MDIRSIELNKEVLERIRPSVGERKKLNDVSARIQELTRNAAKELAIDAHPLPVGSTTRNTWISGDRDIDIFIMLPASLPREKLEAQGIAIARKVSEGADRHEERYAEHPYVHAWFKEYEVDLVPAYSVKDATVIQSAVDRTPFHMEYIKGRIAGLEDEVLLLKQFMKGAGVYGAELKINGFSGYLCELLILHYRSFNNMVESAADWKHGELIDIEGNGTYKGDDPLVVIDPVDANRNVAAAVSHDSFSRMIDASRSYPGSAGMESFFPPEPEPLTPKELEDILKERGTKLIAVKFNAPGMVEDILYPQLKKTERSAVELLQRNGFRVYRSTCWADSGTCIILLEMEVCYLPKIMRHAGPPVTSREHDERFRKKHASRHMFIEGERHVVEMVRPHTSAAGLLGSELTSCSIGKDINAALRNDGCEILEDVNIPLVSGFDKHMRKYFG